MFKNFKIRTKLVSIFVSLVVISLLIVSYIGFNTAGKVLKNSRIDALEEIAHLKRNKIESFFFERKCDIKVVQDYYNIKFNFPVITQFNNDKTNPGYLKAKKILDNQIKTFINAYGYYNELKLVSPDGTVLYTAHGLNEEILLHTALSDREKVAFIKGRTEIHFSDIFLNRSGFSDYKMLITAPIKDFNGTFAGVISLELNIQYIYDFIQDTTGLGNTGETLIAKRIGDKALFLNPLRHDKHAALNRNVIFGDKNAIPMQKALSHEVGKGLSIDYRGENVIAAWQYIPTLNWGLVSKIDVSEAFAPVYELKRKVFVISMTILMLSVLISFIFAKSITKPLEILSNIARKISMGNLTLRAELNSNDEIGILADSFNKMADSLTTAKEERERALKKLESSEKKLRTIITNNIDGVLVVDKKGIICFTNPSAQKIIAKKEGELINMMIGVPIGKSEINMDFRDGFMRTLEMHVIQTGWGEIDANLIMLHDITDRKRVEEEKVNTANIERKKTEELEVAFQKLEKSQRASLNIMEDLKTERARLESEIIDREKLEREKEAMHMTIIQSSKLASLGEVATGIAHEINQPLTYISTFIQNFKRSFKSYIEDETKLKEKIEVSNIQINRINKIILHLRTFGRSDDIDFRLIKIEDVLNNTLLLMRERIRLGNIDLKINIAPALPEVAGNPNRLEEVFINLFQNSVYALSERSSDMQLFVDISVDKNKEAVIIKIIDNGIGISKDNLNKIFDPFFTTKEIGKGTGVGLSIVYGIILEHKGSIICKSELNKGTSFIIKLPVEKQ